VLVGGPPIDIPARTKDGKALDVALTLADVSDSPSPRYVLAVIRDMTDVRRAERELQRALEAMREFVATASHDLRTPLMSVLGFARSLLQSEHQLSEEQRREFLEAILRGATHASRLVDDLLMLSQIQAGVLPSHPQETAVASAVMEAVLRCGVDATFQIDIDLAVLVDPHQLERILVNYLTNAARHGEPPISVTAERDGPMVAIGVRDSGRGVPDEFVPRLFTTFARDGTVTTAGTGLGLSIVRGLAQANGGDAYYESSASGTCFGVRLPVASPVTSAD
jgi:signal transduction histidine kinase